MTKLLLIGSTAALIAAAGEIAASTSEQAPRVAVRQALSSFNVGPGHAIRTVRCARGGVATRGSIVQTKIDGTTYRGGFLDGHGVGRSAWAFGVDFGGPGPATGTFALTCIYSDQPTTLLWKDLEKSREFGPAETLTTTIRCPAGYVPAGATFDHQRTEGSFGGLTPPPRAWVAFTSMRAETRGWRFVATALGGATWRAKYRLRCVRLATGSARGALETRRVIRRVEMAGGTSREFTLRCAPSWLPLFPGWSGFEGVQARLGRLNARYFVSNLSDQPVSVALDLLCIRARAPQGA